MISAPIVTVGNALFLNDYDASRSLGEQALESAVWGGLIGSITGGVGQGLMAKVNGRSFWNGNFKELQKLSPIPSSLNSGANAKDLDANKLTHIFAKEEHGLEVVVKRLGDEKTVMNEVYRELLKSKLPSEGLFTKIVEVAGHPITVKGSMVNGQIRIGTMFIRFIK